MTLVRYVDGSDSQWENEDMTLVRYVDGSNSWLFRIPWFFNGFSAVFQQSEALCTVNG